MNIRVSVSFHGSFIIEINFQLLSNMLNRAISNSQTQFALHGKRRQRRRDLGRILTIVSCGVNSRYQSPSAAHFSKKKTNIKLSSESPSYLMNEAFHDNQT